MSSRIELDRHRGTTWYAATVFLTIRRSASDHRSDLLSPTDFQILFASCSCDLRLSLTVKCLHVTEVDVAA